MKKYSMPCPECSYTVRMSRSDLKSQVKCPECGNKFVPASTKRQKEKQPPSFFFKQRGLIVAVLIGGSLLLGFALVFGYVKKQQAKAQIEKSLAPAEKDQMEDRIESINSDIEQTQRKIEDAKENRKKRSKELSSLREEQKRRRRKIEAIREKIEALDVSKARIDMSSGEKE